MGQYYLTCNLDRQEHLHPHTLGDGLKLVEFGSSSQGTMTALAALLCMRGGTESFRGPWAGDRVVVAGDYADEGNHLPPELSQHNLQAVVRGLEGPDGTPLSTPWADARDSACQAISKLGMPWQLGGSRRQRPADGLGPELAWLADDTLEFEQLEDLIDAFGLSPCEDLASNVEGMCRVLRVEGVSSTRAWQTVVSAQLELDATGQRAVAFAAVFADRERAGSCEHEPPHTLAFPAKPSDVRRWLAIALPAGLHRS